VHPGEPSPDAAPTIVLEPVRDLPDQHGAMPRPRAASESVLPALPWKRIRRAVHAGVLALLVVIGFSIGEALLRPTSESTTAKLAEWGRDHHLGWAVTWLEKVQYDLHPPKKGGALEGGIRVGDATTPTATPSRAQRIVPVHTRRPAPIAPVVQPGLAGEGSWDTLVSGRDGLPLVLGTGLRPDLIHTSYQVGVAWMDPRLVRFELHPGSEDPGGTWRLASGLAGAAAQHRLVAAFNAGFRLPGGQSRGGWYEDGRTVVPLRDGAASFVIYRDGHADIGAWGTDVRMTPDVAAVRQNLDPLLDGGAVNPTVDENNTLAWGFTLGAAKYVPRSGVGITRDGGIVYAAGLTNTRTLAEILARAGCVRAMELDINYEWAVYDYFTHLDGGIIPHKLTPDEQQPADHYFATSSRDFFAVYAR
jgi:uncharacterized protein YigE (DUF2233 family)